MASHQFVTFKIQDKMFGISILSVREINRQLDVRTIPQAPPYVHGLINLRGQIVTVLDLRQRLGMGHSVTHEQSHNIILKSDSEGSGEGDRVGILVDQIGDIITVETSEAAVPPANLDELDSQYLERVVKLDQSIVGILSLNRILSHESAQYSSAA